MVAIRRLAALVCQVWLVRPGLYWSEFARTPAPWLILVGILGVAAHPSATLLSVVGGVWAASASDKVTEAVAIKSGRIFLSNGGAMAPLIGALTKNYTSIAGALPKQRANVTRTANKFLHVMASLAGISESELVNIMEEAGAASDILSPPPGPAVWCQQSTYWPLIRFLLIPFLLIVVSVAIATWLNH